MGLEEKLKKPIKKRKLPEINVPIVLETNNYPAGRNKVLTVTKRQISPKKPSGKHQPSYIHASLQFNPDNFQIKEYFETRKDVYAFSGKEARSLLEETRFDMGVSLLASVNYSYQKNGKIVVKRKWRFEDFRKTLKEKLKKYEKWRNKNA